MGFTFRILNTEDAADVRKLLEEHYTPKYILMKHLGITNEELRETYYSRIESFLEQGNSHGVFDETGDLVAVNISVKHDNKEKSKYQKKLDPHSKLAAIARLMKYIGRDDLPDILGTTEFWEGKMTTIHPKYRHTGLVKELHSRNIELARQKGIKKVVGFQTYQQPLDNSLDLYVVRQIDLREYTDSITGKKLFAGLKPPNHMQFIYGCDVDRDPSVSLKSNL